MYIICIMAKANPSTKPIPVRFKADQHARVVRAAKRTGLTAACIIRLGVSQVLPQIEAGNLKIPA